MISYIGYKLGMFTFDTLFISDILYNNLNNFYMYINKKSTFTGE